MGGRGYSKGGSGQRDGGWRSGDRPGYEPYRRQSRDAPRSRDRRDERDRREEQRYRDDARDNGYRERDNARGRALGSRSRGESERNEAPRAPADRFRDASRTAPERDSRPELVKQSPPEAEQPAPAAAMSLEQLLGFTQFGSTKGTSVRDANVSAANVHKRPVYRRYMKAKTIKRLPSPTADADIGPVPPADD